MTARYDVKRFLLQEDIKRLIVLVETDIDYVEGNLKDLVYPDRSEFRNVEGPRKSTFSSTQYLSRP